MILVRLVHKVKEELLANQAKLAFLVNKVVLALKVNKVNAVNVVLLVLSVRQVNLVLEVFQGRKVQKEEKAPKVIKAQSAKPVNLVYQEMMVPLVRRVKQVRFLVNVVNLVSMVSLGKTVNQDGLVKTDYLDLAVNKAKQVFLVILVLMVQMEHQVKEGPQVKKAIKERADQKVHLGDLVSLACPEIPVDPDYLVKMDVPDNLVWKDQKVMQGFPDYLDLDNRVLLVRKEKRVIADSPAKMGGLDVFFKKVLVVLLVQKVNLDYPVKLALMVHVAKLSKVICTSIEYFCLK